MWRRIYYGDRKVVDLKTVKNKNKTKGGVLWPYGPHVPRCVTSLGLGGSSELIRNLIRRLKCVTQ
jgi:hypothetical protein